MPLATDLRSMSDSRLDASLRLVSDRQRRRILRRLRDDPTGTTTLEDLLDDLSDGGAAPTADPPDRDRLSIQLIHSHLPKLNDHGVIDYDRDDEVIRYRPDEGVETVLDALPADEAQPLRDP